MPLTTNQQMIVNTAMRLVSWLDDADKREADPAFGHKLDLKTVEDLVRVGANAFIDLNRIADALEGANELNKVESAVAGLQSAVTQFTQGSIDDFAMWLTTRPEVLKVGATEPVPNMIAVLQEYRKLKGMNGNPI
jgi:hypothetical protein